MLTSLRIRNFRGFRDLEVGELSRINIFAGRNNAGKSTLLEAVFLLGGAGDPTMALNTHVVRAQPGMPAPSRASQTLWKPLFSGLDTEAEITLSATSSSNEDMTLTIGLQRSATTTASRAGDDGVLTRGRSGEPVLRFKYTDSRTAPFESEARETAGKVVFDGETTHVAFRGSIIQPGRALKTDTAKLGELRRQKRGDLILSPLQLVDPRIQTIEDNASSDTPVILVDIGLPELVPLSTMGAGMTHLVRIVLAIATAQGGVVLIDEIENGLHHSILPTVWGVIAEAAERLDVQVFATTHSFECVEAAHNALGPDGFRLHRLEVVDNQSRCVTLSPTAIDGVIRHNLEVR